MNQHIASLCLLACSLAATQVHAQCTGTQIRNGGTAETATISFANLNNGQGLSVTVAGRNLTCTATTQASNVRTFYVSGTVPANCTASGTLTGWTAAAGAGASQAVFTSTATGNVTNISTSGNFGTVSTVDGAQGLEALLTGSLLCARPGPGYTGDPADRWQEQHRSGGLLFDFKRGVGHPVDPEKQVGTYSFTGTGQASLVTHNYGGAITFSWRVFLQAAPNTYSFCNTTNTEVVRALVIANAGVSGSGCASFP